MAQPCLFPKASHLIKKLCTQLTYIFFPDNLCVEQSEVWEYVYHFSNKTKILQFLYLLSNPLAPQATLASSGVCLF